jgi:GH25 family lysozyme M1 (1,4-beta-N-acetylmuramidase)
MEAVYKHGGKRMTINIIDVSHWQEHLDWGRIKYNLNIDGVMIKTTQGTDYVDPLFEENRAGAISIGMPFGLFHFLAYTLKLYKPGNEIAYGREQGDWFWDHIKGNPGQLRPAIDQETNEAAAGWEPITIFNVGRVLKISLACFTRIYELSGRYPSMYTPGWIARSMKNFTQGGYWGGRYANYTPLERFLTWEELMLRRQPELGAYLKWDFWQYSSKGIGWNFGMKTHATWAAVDLNVFHGDAEAYSKYCGVNCVPTVPEDPTPEDEPTPEPVLTGKTAVVASRDGGVNLRKYIGTISDWVGFASNGAILDVLGYGKDSLGNAWIRTGYQQWACVNYNGIPLVQL